LSVSQKHHHNGNYQIEEDDMKFISESLPSQFIHSITDIKLKNDDPLKIWFEAIDWNPWGVVFGQKTTIFIKS